MIWLSENEMKFEQCLRPVNFIDANWITCILFLTFHPCIIVCYRNHYSEIKIPSSPCQILKRGKGWRNGGLSGPLDPDAKLLCDLHGGRGVSVSGPNASSLHDGLLGCLWAAWTVTSGPQLHLPNPPFIFSIFTL